MHYDKDSNQLHCEIRSNYRDSYDVTVSYDAAAMRFWRIATDSDAINFLTSPDGQTWSIRRSAPIPDFAEKVRVIFSAFSSSVSDQPPQARFSDVNTSPQLGGTRSDIISLTVDYGDGNLSYPVGTWSLGATISCYSGTGLANINKSTDWKEALKQLGPIAWRFPQQYGNGSPGSSAGGAQTTGDGDNYVANIRSIGGKPYPVVGGASGDNNFPDSDVAGYIQHYNAGGGQNGGPIERIVIGNEPDNGGDVEPYLNALAGRISAVKAVDPQVLVSAPGAAYFNRDLLSKVATHNIDILSYHAYDGDVTYPATSQYGSNIDAMRSIKPGILYACEEGNWHPSLQSAKNKNAFLSWKNLCFIASAACHSISHGGAFFQYSDSNGVLGLLADGQDADGLLPTFLTPLPSYWALGMLTGMNGKFLSFTSGKNDRCISLPPTPDTDIEVFAWTTGKIIVINKSESNCKEVALTVQNRQFRNVNVWQTRKDAPFAGPEQKQSAIPFVTPFHVECPPGTVTSVDLS
ncbi:hypothetical protein [Streptomyces sp. 900105245]